MISKKDVEYVSKLARIHLDDEAAGHLTKDLEKILGYVEQLKELDTSDVKPTSHALPLTDVLREDEPQKSLAQEEVMKFSVEQHEGYFKVPKVIE